MVAVAAVTQFVRLCVCCCLHSLQCPHIQPQVPECMCVRPREGERGREKEGLRESPLKGIRSMKHSTISKGQGVH